LRFHDFYFSHFFISLYASFAPSCPGRIATRVFYPFHNGLTPSHALTHFPFKRAHFFLFFFSFCFVLLFFPSSESCHHCTSFGELQDAPPLSQLVSCFLLSLSSSCGGHSAVATTWNPLTPPNHFFSSIYPSDLFFFKLPLFPAVFFLMRTRLVGASPGPSDSAFLKTIDQLSPGIA